MIGLRIVAPHFVAGLLATERGEVTTTAPILAYMKGWSVTRVEVYCRRKGWGVEDLSGPYFRCPTCGMVSHHPDDLAHGYCGACHAFTGSRQG